MTELKSEAYCISGARLGGENPLPVFRNPEPDNNKLIFDPALPSEKRNLAGWQTGWRALPYRMQDRYTRNKEPLAFKSAVLENEILRAVFLPELGGRLVSLVYKPLKRELLERNAVFQPANLAIRNAWFSGGVEWNTGQLGHAFYTCSPVFAAQIRGLQGEPALRIYDYERCKNHFWQIDFFLPPGFPFLLASVRVMNPFDRSSSMYWWTNIAVPEAKDVRVLAPARQALYPMHAMNMSDMPELPILPGKDASYSMNFPFANEYFFQCEKADMLWEAALDGKGTGLIEASTHPLNYRKLFCWGHGVGGRRWQEYLSVPGRAYIEIQAGLAPSQSHGLAMPPNGEYKWLEAFGYMEVDPVLAHNPDWQTAWQGVDKELKKRLPLDKLNELSAACGTMTDRPPEKIMHEGSGWGALEIRRRKTAKNAGPLPESFAFPESTLGIEQKKWIHLLEKGRLPEQDPAEEPGEWMIQEEWRELLEDSLKNDGNWYALLQTGVMRMENFDEAGARRAWEDSIRHRPSAWAYRNLAALAMRQKRNADALRDYKKAWDMAAGSLCAQTALAQELLQALFDSGEYDQAGLVYHELPDAVKEFDRIQIIRGKIALNRGELDVVEAVLRREYAVIQEGETALTDLWFGMWEKRLALETGRTIDDNLKAEACRLHPPPARIDFRMK